jgi:hypothetical protein
MQLSGDGTNSAQNNTFLDSSTNNFTITRNGNTTQGTFSPYGSNWSNYFDGSSYLSAPANAAYNFGTGDFTIEFWAYTTSTARQIIFGNYSASGSTYGWAVQININSTGDLFFGWGNATVANPSGVWTANQWNHVAISRSGTTTKLFVNGVQAASVTDNTNYNNGNNVVLGRNSDLGVSAFSFTGYISNARVVKGTAVYTSAFTPPTTPLTAITNTSLLTCQSNRFIDNSTNNWAITVAGTPSVQRWSPFSPTAVYSASVIGGSGYFNGTVGAESGQPYLSVADNAALQMSTGNFTVEFFWNPSTIANYQSPFDKGYTGAGSLLLQTGNGDGRLIVYAGNSVVITSSTAVTVGTWNHIALVRTGTTLRLFQNGVSVGSATNSTNFNNTATLGLGAAATAPGGGGVGAYPINGYLSNVRVIKGSSPYDATQTTLTVPTTPLTAISGTSLLTNFTNGGITDTAMINDLETVGNAQISTSVKKYGTGSISYPSTGSYLYTAWKPNLEIGAGDFTIEFWMYGTSGNPLFCWSVDWHFGMTWNYGGANANRIGVWMSSNGSSWNIFNADGGGNGISTGTVSPNTWTHVALVRNGSAWTLYLNGTSAWTGTSSATVVTRSTDIFRVGGPWPNAGPVDYVGYLDDFRFTRGYARYTSNFTPPAQAFDAPAQVTAASDSYFRQVTLLLRGNGTNGAQNNTFLDSSSNNFTITRNGNTTQGSFSPYGANWSNFFPTTNNGSDNLSIAQNAGLSFTASDDITVEAWINLSAHNTYSFICSKGNSSTREWAFAVTSTDIRFYWSTNLSNTGDSVINSSFAFQLNTWYHVAACKSGSSVRLFVNGIQQGATGTFTTISNASSPFRVGTFMDFTNISHCFAGNISNLRFVKSTALYTSNFTPSPTPLTNVTGAQVLTCQSNRFRDNSTNAFAITVNGTPSVQRWSPFSPSAAYSTSVIGGSGYFDGSGDKLTLANSSAFDCGTGNDFCMEMWAYATYYTNSQHYWSSHQGGVPNGFYFSNATGAGRYPSLQIYSGGGGGAGVASNVLMPLNQWNHICVTRQSGRMRIFLNGELTGTTTTSFQVNTDGHLLGINGGDNFNGDGGWYGGGRYINGSVPTTYQTASTTLNTQIFTPPTAPFTTTSQGAVAGDVKVLVTFTNGGISDNAMMNNLETVGNAQISTSVVKYGTGSMSFNGSNSYLTAKNNDILNFGTGDFTVEFWINASAAGNYTQVVGTLVSGTEAGTWRIGNRFNSTNQVYFARGNGGGFDEFRYATNVNDGAWHHVAVTRASGTVRIFVDGVLGTSSNITGTCSSTNPLYVGYNGRDGDYFTGYIDDLRITRGYARYTTNFTPPTQELPGS